jgi:hypothetical protein
MSERLSHLPERDQGPDPELEKQKQETLRELHEKAKQAEHEYVKNVEHIRSQAEREAASAEKTKAELVPEKTDNDQPLHVNYELKNMAYKRTLKRTRSRLPAPVRPFSRLIHQPVIETMSEFGAKTVARPSGILAGGIAAFLGSSLVLWISRHYGYEYNFLLFALLFVGGFFVGLIIEMLFRLIKRSK